MKLLISLTALTILILPVTGHSNPSFDCTKAERIAERHICTSSELSKQDRILAKKYQALLDLGMPGLKERQRQWLRSRNQCGREKASEITNCISEQYRIRILELEQLERKVKASHEKSWRPHFVTADTEIPTNAFKAHYFDERTAGITRHTEVVKIPSIHYCRNTFHKIPAENIGAYYIGKFHFDKSTIKNLNVFQGNAESSIYINGVKLWQGDKYSIVKEYLFNPGPHIIEIQYVTKHHCAGFMFTMTEINLVKQAKDLANLDIAYEDADIWYCGVYETDNFDGNIYVDLGKSRRPIILFLCSYEPVIWNFHGADLDNLRAVVISSWHPGSLLANMDKDIPVNYVEKLPYVYDTNKSSSSNRKNSFKNLVYYIQDITQKKIVGFSGKYKLGNVRIPEKDLDEQFYKTIGMTLHPKPKSYKKKDKSFLDRVFE